MNMTELIANLKPGMTSVNVNVIVLEAGNPTPSSNGSKILLRVADGSGSIYVTVMIQDAHAGWRPGDMLRIKGAQTGFYQSSLTLIVGRQAECMKYNEFLMVYSEYPNLSERVADTSSFIQKASIFDENRIGGGRSQSTGHRGPFQQKPRYPL